MTDWIKWEWTPEKPYPETLETMVYVKFRNGEVGKGIVGHMHDDNSKASNWFDHKDDESTVEYKVAK